MVLPTMAFTEQENAPKTCLHSGLMDAFPHFSDDSILCEVNKTSLPDVGFENTFLVFVNSVPFPCLLFVIVFVFLFLFFPHPFKYFQACDFILLRLEHPMLYNNF